MKPRTTGILAALHVKESKAFHSRDAAMQKMVRIQERQILTGARNCPTSSQEISGATDNKNYKNHTACGLRSTAAIISD